MKRLLLKKLFPSLLDMLTSMSICDLCVSCSSAKIQNCKKMFTLGARGFSWKVSGFGQVLTVTRAFFLFCLLSYFSFSLNWPAFFSRGRHPAKAPRCTREKTSCTQGKRCLVKQIFFRMADMSSVELYWFCCFSSFGGRSSFISSLQIMQWKFSDLFASY